MSQNTAWKQIEKGFKRAGAWLLGIAWLFLVFSGLAIITTPPPPSPTVGWGLLGIAALVLLLTMDKWVKVFPGLLAYGAFASILMLFSGHAVNHPEVVVSRLEAMAALMFFAAAGMLSLNFTKHKLTVPDRVALFAFVLCFFWQAVAPRLLLFALAIGFSCLVGAWTYDRVNGNGKRSHPQTTEDASL
jgi:chromate transport protein ChrA